MRKQTKTWKTKDGERIRICDMTNEHLENTIKMLYRMAQGQQAGCLFPDFDPESMATYCVEQAYDYVMGLEGEDLIGHFFPAHGFALFADAYRRGMQPEEWWT